MHVMNETVPRRGPQVADERLRVGEVVEVTAPPQAHVAAEVLPLHVLEQLVGAVEPQGLAAVAAVVAELARRMAGNVCRQLGRRPSLELQRERSMLLHMCAKRGNEDARKANVTVSNMGCTILHASGRRLLHQPDVHK